MRSTTSSRVLAATTVTLARADHHQPQPHAVVRLPLQQRQRNTGSVTPSQGISREWFADVAIGTPPQTFSVALDTGSSVLWVTARGCNSSGVVGEMCTRCPLFNSADSSTYIVNGSDFLAGYGGGSASGTWGQDDVTLGGLTVSGMLFGEVTQTNVYLLGRDREFCGIVGLSCSIESYSFFEMLTEQHPSMESRFAFSLPKNTLPAQPDAMGELMLGGVDPTAFQGQLVTVPVSCPSCPYWGVAEMTFEIDGTKVSSFAFIDSGAMGAGAFPTAISSSIAARTDTRYNFTAARGGDYSGTVTARCEDFVSKGSTLTVSVAEGSDGSFDLSPTDYGIEAVVFGLLPPGESGEGQCVGPLGDTSAQLGNKFLAAVYTVHDLKQKTLSFAYAKHD